jgi:hypothetical protein
VTLGHGVYFLTTCTARKSRVPAPEFLFRNAPSFEDWRGRRSEQLLAARDLYQGDNAHQALDGPEFWGKETIERRVISAGFGLLDWDSKISAYSATFQRGHEDSIDRVEKPRSWWNHFPGVAELARQKPQTPILIAAGEVYVNAMLDDLLAARNSLEDPADLMILSAGCRNIGELNDNLLPASADFRPAVGGTLSALNVRLANWLLRQNPVDPRASLERLRALTNPEPRPNRSKRTDSEVAAYIRGNAVVERTPLLRKFRSAGHACGESRFNRIYKMIIT